MVREYVLQTISQREFPAPAMVFLLLRTFAGLAVPVVTLTATGQGFLKEVIGITQLLFTKPLI